MLFATGCTELGGRMRNLIAAIGFGMMLAACQTTGEGTSVGAPQTSVPPDYRTQAVKFFHGYLKDPYSVRSAEISAPMEQFAGLLDGGMRPAVCVRFNAKNAFGAYVGQRTHVVVFENGKVHRGGEYMYACNGGVVYHPFPELEIDQRAAFAQRR